MTTATIYFLCFLFFFSPFSVGRWVWRSYSVSHSLSYTDRSSFRFLFSSTLILFLAYIMPPTIKITVTVEKLSEQGGGATLIGYKALNTVFDSNGIEQSVWRTDVLSIFFSCIHFTSLSPHPLFSIACIYLSGALFLSAVRNLSCIILITLRAYANDDVQP